MSVPRLVVTFFLLFATGIGQELRVAAASDMQPVLPRIAQNFEQHTGVKVLLSFGASGTLAAQIENGAPFDVFLSADAATTQQLAKSGFALAETDRVYGLGHLSLLFAIQRVCRGTDCLRALTAADIRHVAVANPAHAPYGRAAVAALKSAGLYEQLGPKLVFGENIAQAAQFVVTGNAEAALVSNSACLAMAKPCIAVDAPPLEQHAVVLKRSRLQKLAHRFLEELDSSTARHLLQEHGFTFLVTTTLPKTAK